MYSMQHTISTSIKYIVLKFTGSVQYLVVLLTFVLHFKIVCNRTTGVHLRSQIFQKVKKCKILLLRFIYNKLIFRFVSLHFTKCLAIFAGHGRASITRGLRYAVLIEEEWRKKPRPTDVIVLWGKIAAHMLLFRLCSRRVDKRRAG